MHFSVHGWRGYQRTLLNFAQKNWKYTARKQHCVSFWSSFPTQSSCICLHVVPLFERNVVVKKCLRTVFSHHGGKGCLSYFLILFVEAGRNFIIPPLLTKESPVTHKISFADHWNRHREIRWNERSWNYSGMCTRAFTLLVASCSVSSVSDILCLLNAFFII